MTFPRSNLFIAIDGLSRSFVRGDELILGKIARQWHGGLSAWYCTMPKGPFETTPSMRLTLYFIFGGLGCGCIIAAYALSLAGGISRGDLILTNLTGGAVLAIGLGWVWAPIGSRLRHTGIFLRPTPSWTTYETYTAVAFFLALATLAKVPAPAIELLVVLGAAAFMLCQANVARSSKSRPAWRTAEIPSLIVIMGLASGVGLIALLSALAPPIIRAGTLAPIAGMTLAAMGAYRWKEYERNAESALQGEIAALSPTVYFFAYALPFACYLAALFLGPGTSWILPGAGVSAIVGGAIWTHVLIARLGHPRDFTASPVGL